MKETGLNWIISKRVYEVGILHHKLLSEMRHQLKQNPYKITPILPHRKVLTEELLQDYFSNLLDLFTGNLVFDFSLNQFFQVDLNFKVKDPSLFFSTSKYQFKSDVTITFTDQ